MFCRVRVRVRHRQIEFKTGKAAKYSVKHARADLEKVFNVLQIPNMPFSNVPQTIKFGTQLY